MIKNIKITPHIFLYSNAVTLWQGNHLRQLHKERKRKRKRKQKN